MLRVFRVFSMMGVLVGLLAGVVLPGYIPVLAVPLGSRAVDVCFMVAGRVGCPCVVARHGARVSKSWCERVKLKSSRDLPLDLTFHTSRSHRQKKVYATKAFQYVYPKK